MVTASNGVGAPTLFAGAALGATVGLAPADGPGLDESVDPLVSWQPARVRVPTTTITANRATGTGFQLTAARIG